jgi:hypothetical protein
MDTVDFITTEMGKDLIVSFALVRKDDPEAINSLVLLRTPMFEAFLDQSERGVTVSLESEDDDERDLLREVRFDKDAATILLRTESREYELDLGNVEPVDLERMCISFRKMNFDQRLQLSGI